VCTRALIGFALSVLLVASPVHAQVLAAPALSSRSVEPEARERLLWTAAALDRILAAQDYPTTLMLSALGRATAARGDEAAATADPLVRALGFERALSAFGGVTGASLGGRLAGCREQADAVLGVLCSMEELVPLAPPELARDLTEQGANLVFLSASGRGTSGVQHDADPLQGLAEHALEVAWRTRAMGLDRTDALVGQLVGVPTVGGPAAFGAVTPELRGLLEAYPLWGAVGGGAAFGLPDASHRAFIDDLMGSLARGSTSSTSARAQWAAGRSFVYLAAEAAGLSGAERGVSERIRSLGTAAVDLKREADELPNRLASLGAGLASAAFSGNVLGIVSRITSFFQGSSGGLGPDAARDVRALREGLQSMRSDFDTRLGGLNAGMEDLFATVDSRFTELERLVDTSGRDVRRELAALNQSVQALAARLDWMDANTRSYVQAGFDRDYTRTLVRCLEHRERYAPPWDEMSFAVFSECLADFRARAVVDAADALLTDQSTGLDDLSLVAALTNSSLTDLAFRLPLLGRVAAERFGYPGLAGGYGLANLVEWRMAAEAYLVMLGDWPEHARAVRPGDLELMRAVGVGLRGALRGIAHDPADVAGAPLLDRVLAYYGSRLSELTDEGGALALRHRQLTLLRVDPASVLTRVDPESASGPALAVPGSVAAAVPTVLRTAAVLGLDDASLRYRLSSQDSVIRGDSRHAFLFFGRRHDRLTYTRTTVEVELRAATLGTVARFTAAGPYFLRRTEEMSGDERSDRVRRRVDHIADPDNHFVESAWPFLASDADAWTADLVGAGFIPLLEERVEGALRRHATSGLDNVFGAVCASAPRTDGLSGDDRGSALRIRNALSGMSAARVLLEAYLRLALPDAIESDDRLRAALMASDGVLDRERLCAAVATGESALRLVWLEEEPGRRLAELRAAVDDALIGEAGSATLVDGTLGRIEAAIRVQRLRAATATR